MLRNAFFQGIINVIIIITLDEPCFQTDLKATTVTGIACAQYRTVRDYPVALNIDLACSPVPR